MLIAEIARNCGSYPTPTWADIDPQESESETMSDEINPREAVERIRKAIVGKPPANYQTEVGRDAEDEPIMGMATPLSDKIQAGDTRTLCRLVPKEVRSQVVKDLLRGTQGMPDGFKVQNQTQDLHHLLKVVGPYLPSDKPPEE